MSSRCNRSGVQPRRQADDRLGTPAGGQRERRLRRDLQAREPAAEAGRRPAEGRPDLAEQYPEYAARNDRGKSGYNEPTQSMRVPIKAGIRLHSALADWSA
ncbi:hypothetical protein [Kribbella aluminosa]|uniref:hypothetical protein n=1 Tax=Kribbella aluminosa TaxID=416017 RepID=UPI0031E39730